MSERYKVESGSRLGHGCCFSATVVDTMAPVDDDLARIVAECFDEERAQLIANALNSTKENT